MFRIFGPPGTGKTTTLLNMVDKALSEGIAPTEIAFLAFTRKAANEAKERASERFSLDPDADLFFFRTLHSLAYRMLGLQDSQLMKTENYKELAEYTGIRLTTIKNDAEFENGKIAVTDHPVLGLINLAAIKKLSLREEYDRTDFYHDWTEVSYIDTSYREYKVSNGLLDYTDMLVMYARQLKNCTPRFKLCFLDEAQDLSPIQWDIAHSLDDISDKMYVAGDDDQAIYRWSGADVQHFIELDSGSQVLEQSYRIPRQVHEVAERIADRITDRFPKKYLPKQAEGTVRRIYDMDELDMGEGSWLVLAQANFFLDDFDASLRSMGFLFEKAHGRSISERLSEAVNGWEQLRKGREVTLHAAQTIYGYMSGNGKKIARGHKTINAEEEELFSLKRLQDDFGLLATKDEIWHEAMDKLPATDRAYMTALLRRGESFNGKPRIRLSTIHASKGGEADNVVLLTSLTPAASRAQNTDIHRVFYVAVTRARENLFLMDGQDYFENYLV